MLPDNWNSYKIGAQRAEVETYTEPPHSAVRCDGECAKYNVNCFFLKKMFTKMKIL